jgi:hypothetical protein
LKVPILTDTHFGVRGDNARFHAYFKRFYREVFFPYLDAHSDITHMIHCGDVGDRRKYINFATANTLRTELIEPLIEREMFTDWIVGNHDASYKNSNNLNMLDELYGGRYPFMDIHSEACEKQYGDRLTMLVPWINEENRVKTMEMVDRTKALTCFGHFEFAGFDMYKGMPAQGKQDTEAFTKFDLVGSGHFHTRSKKGNIQYLGAACQYTWSDFGDPRGFNVWDTETNTLEFIQNPIEIFKKVFYDDDGEPVIDTNPADLKDCIVKMVVVNKSNPSLFDKIVASIEDQDVIDLQIVDDHKHQDDLSDSDIVNEAESTIDIFTNYIDSVGTGSVDKNGLKSLMVDLYHEAIEIGQVI